jgi:HSP20 family protein
MALLKSQDFEDMFYRPKKPVNLHQSRGYKAVAQGDWTPIADISGTNTVFVITLRIPDVAKEDIKVTISNGVLTIQGERKQVNENIEKRYQGLEPYYGIFKQSFTLPDNVDVTKVKATFKKDMLNLQIQKIKVAKPKAIVVKVE